MIRIGSRILKKQLDEGWYFARIEAIEEAEDVVLAEGLKLPAVEIFFSIRVKEDYTINKSKTYIVSAKKGSELHELISNILPEENPNKDGIDLLDLLDKNCKLEIRVDYSQRGNRFENIGGIRGVEADE